MSRNNFKFIVNENVNSYESCIHLIINIHLNKHSPNRNKDNASVVCRSQIVFSLIEKV